MSKPGKALRPPNSPRNPGKSMGTMDHEWAKTVRILCGVVIAGVVVVVPGESLSSQDDSPCARDSAGPFSINYFTPMTDTLEIEATIRAFVWDHWQGKRSGSVKATWYSLEGAPTRVEYLIEASDNGRWSVVVTSEYTEPMHDSHSPQHVTRRTIRAERVERRAVLPDGSTGEVIDAATIVQANGYKVVLLDADGKVAESI